MFTGFGGGGEIVACVILFGGPLLAALDCEKASLVRHVLVGHSSMPEHTWMC